MPNNRKLLIILPAILIFLVAINLILWFGLHRPGSVIKPPPAENQVVAPTPPKIAGRLTLSPVIKTSSTNETLVELWLEPEADTPASLSTFSFQTSITPSQGTISPKNNQPAIGPQFKDTKWSIPFSSVELQSDGSVNVKLAAIYASPNPFSIDARVMVASFPVKLSTPTAKLNYLLDAQNSKVYNKQGDLYTLTLNP